MFQDIDHRLPKISVLAIFNIAFHESLLKRDVPSTHSKPDRGKFCDNAHLYKLFMPQHVRYDNSLFL